MCLFGIRMINVGFGDCFLLESKFEKEYLLVDCGTRSFNGLSQKYTKFDDLAKALQQKFQRCTVRHSALITHFHEDHYSGFLKWYKWMKPDWSKTDWFSDGLFDTIYVPYILVDNSAKENYIIKLLIAAYLLFPANSALFRLSQNVLKQIEMLSCLSKNADVQPLGHFDSAKTSYVARRSFSFGGFEFQVIWPDVSNPKAYDKVSLDVDDYFWKRIAQTGESFDLGEVQETIIANFKKWYALNGPERGNAETRQEELETIIRSQNDCLRRLDDSKGTVLEKLSEDDIRLLRSLFQAEENHHSHQHVINVVFQDEWKSNVLMLGDINKTIFEEVLRKESRISFRRYDAIKVAHHGTKAYYSKSLPNARCLLISNGKHGTQRKISCLYGTHGNGDTKRLCTAGDTNCEIAATSKVCRKGTCHNECAVYDVWDGV